MTMTHPTTEQRELLELKHYEAVIEIGFGARVISIQAKDHAEACDKARKYASTFYNSRMTNIREVPAAIAKGEKA